MSPSAPPPTNPQPRAMDPWVAFGRISGGVLLYGVVGWLLDQWWDTSFCLPVGIVLGAGLGLWATFAGLRQQG